MELAVEAEAHGMDSAAVSDHFQPCRQGAGTRRSRWPGGPLSVSAPAAAAGNLSADADVDAAISGHDEAASAT